MKGLDILALGSAYWPLEMTLEELPNGSAVGFFDNTFGDVTKNILALLKSGKICAARVHIWYSKHHMLCPLSLLKKRLEFYDKLTRTYTETRFFISHTCEYKSSERDAVARRVGLIRELCPFAIPVNSLLEGVRLRDELTELHTKRKLARENNTLSNDGFELNDREFKSYLWAGRRAPLVLTWIPSFNMRRDANDGAIPPKLRKHAPTREEFQRMVRVTYG